MDQAGPGLAVKLRGCDGPGRAAAHHLKVFKRMSWAGPWPIISKFDEPGRAAACVRHPSCPLDGSRVEGPARVAAHEMWFYCTTTYNYFYSTTTTTSAPPMRRPTGFHARDTGGSVYNLFQKEQKSVLLMLR